MSNTLTIEVRPKVLVAPTVDAGPDLNVQLPTDSVNLTMIASDIDGVIVSYLWEYVSGFTDYGFIIVNPNSPSTLIKSLSAGTVVLRATVTDDDGQTASDEVSITTIGQSPLDPIAANDGPYIVNIGMNYETRIALEVPITSLTSGGSPLPTDQYAFIISETNPDTSVYGLTASFFDQYGADYVSVNVIRNGNPPKLGTIIAWETSTNELILEIPDFLAAGESESAIPETNVSLYAKRTAIDIDSTESYDPDGYIDSRLWSWLSGRAHAEIETPSTTQTKVSSLIYTGTYSLQIEVTDDGGNKNAAGTTIVITDTPLTNKLGEGAAVDAGSEKSVTVTSSLGGSVALEATSIVPSTTQSSAHEWVVLSSPEGTVILPTIENPDSTTPTVKFQAGADSGRYTIGVTLTTDEGIKTSDTVDITVVTSGLYLETVSEVISPAGVNTVNLAIRGGQAGESVSLLFSMSSEETGTNENYVDILDGDGQETRLQDPGLTSITKVVVLNGSGEFAFINEISLEPLAAFTDIHSASITTTIAAGTSSISTPSTLTHSHEITV